MAHLCAEALEGGWCLLPAERHRMLRACACLVWLLDCPAGGGPNAFLSRKLRRDRLGRLFKVSPVVPLYGDMHANLPLILRRCPNFSPAAAAELLPHSRREMESLTGSYDMVAAAGSLRSLVVDYTASLPALLRRADALGGRRLGRDERGALARAVYEQVLRGCRYMAAVHSRLSELVARGGVHGALFTPPSCA